MDLRALRSQCMGIDQRVGIARSHTLTSQRKGERQRERARVGEHDQLLEAPKTFR